LLIIFVKPKKKKIVVRIGYCLCG